MTASTDVEPSCPNCHTTVAPGDKFCEFCGTSLLSPPVAAAAPAPLPGAEVSHRAGTAAARASGVRGPCPECGGSQADDGYCTQCGGRMPDGTDHFEADLGLVALISDLGLVHSRNEDAVAAAVAEAGVAAVVCDGISTVSRPEEASVAAVEAALDELLRGLTRLEGEPASPTGHLAAVEQAFRAVAALDTLGEVNPPACTYVAATLSAGATGGEEIIVSWIGDSRAYWLSRETDRSERLTEDDSWAGELVRAGLLDQAAAMAAPQAHAITRWIGSDVGGDPEAKRPHVLTRPVERDGVLLVCSDGLWNYLPEHQQLADVVFAAHDTMDAVRALCRLALDAGGDDNITIVLIDVPATERTT